MGKKAEKYWPAENAKTLGEELIPKYHPHLSEATIVYVFIEKMKSKGRDTLGKMKAASAMEDYFGDVDYVMIINDARWGGLSVDQKIALVDHELCHAVRKIHEKTGEASFSVRGHDVEEFREIVARRGLWEPSLEEFAGVLAEQLPLPLTGKDA